MKKVSLEQFVEDCREISRLAMASKESGGLPYVCTRGLRSGAQIIDEAITYFSGDTIKRTKKEDASRLQTTEFGLQTLRDSCMITEEEGRKNEVLQQLRAIINRIGGYSIKTGNLEYSFSRISPPLESPESRLN